MTPEDQAKVESFAPILSQAHDACIKHIDRELDSAGHSPRDFATIVLTIHRKLGIVALGADMPREDALHLMHSTAVQATQQEVVEKQLKILEN